MAYVRALSSEEAAELIKTGKIQTLYNNSYSDRVGTSSVSFRSAGDTGRNGSIQNYIDNSGGNAKVVSELYSSDNSGVFVGKKLAVGGGSSGGNFGKVIANSNGSTSYVKFDSDSSGGVAAGGNFDNGVKIGNSGGGVSYYQSNGDIKIPSLVEGNKTYIGANGGKVVTGSKEYVESVVGDIDNPGTKIGQNSYYKSDSDSNSRAVNESGGYTESVSRGGSYAGVAGGVGAASSAAGGLGTLKLDLNNVGQFANSIEKCAEQLDNVWKKVQTKDIEVINNSWASEDAQEYVNKLNEEGEKIKYIVSSLKILSKTYNSIASEGGNAQQDIGRTIRNI